MFETGSRQFRMAIGMIRGRRLDTRNLGRLVDDALATIAEFGEPGADAQQLIDGPLADPGERAEFVKHALRRTARRLAVHSPFYARQFAAHVQPGKLDAAALRAIPVTTKQDLTERPGDFLCTDAEAVLTTRTTGTTGRPAEIRLSRYELELWAALSALSSVLLDELVMAARRAGCRPGDFQLRRIVAGGEILSPSLAQAACQTFGVPHVDDSFSMTEVIPVTGRTCSHAHLHHDLNTGLTELLDLRTVEPAAPGALGTVVITPYFPYRDCMPVFRYDTRDVARCLPDEPLTCELAGIPAMSQVLGKSDHLLQLDTGDVITPRQLIHAIEALPTAPWPARYRADVRDGRARLTLPVAAINGYSEAAARRHFAASGLDVDLVIVGDDQAAVLRNTRSDLHETTFANRQALVGA